MGNLKVAVFEMMILLVGLCLAAKPASGDDESGTLGPWRIGDVAYSTTLSDDRPNAESLALKGKYYQALIPERVCKGEKGVLSFRVSPRCVGWAGILVLDKDGKPVLQSANMNNVSITDMGGAPVNEFGWIQHDTKALYTDASPVAWPKTRIIVRPGRPRNPYTREKANTTSEPIDQATIDFSQWKLADSKVQMAALLDGPTSKHGFVLSKNGSFIRDGKPLYLWGGHENHIVDKAYSDLYAETYSDAGINVQRSIAFEEMVANPATGEIDKTKLDKYHYLIAKLGEKGIYFVMSCSGFGYLNGVWGFERGKEPEDVKKDPYFHFWVAPVVRQAWKSAYRTVLTTPNPYNGRAIKDDPTVIGIELCNETGLNERRFDFNRFDSPEVTRQWRAEFNKFLLKKYGSREALAKAWEQHPLFAHEDPAKGTILLPTNYRGARSPYGGTGQHDQFTTGRWYMNGKKFGLPAKFNPRILDAIEFNNTVARKSHPFDFNNLTTSEETEKLRIAFNDFLLKKYGSREALAKAWEEDPLFPWETPSESVDKKTGKADPKLSQKTIMIPTNYRGQDKYEEDLAARLADPRVGDAMEFTYAVQKDWATDMAKFLKEDVGMKCGIGWNGDTFHVVQAPNHKANMDSPLDIAIAAAYLDWDNGDQITSRTKNLKRFNAYGRILGRPMFAYEWSIWTTQGPFVYEYALLAALMGRVYGFDGYAHHKMGAFKYPVSDAEYSLKVHYITPLSDRPRRGVFYVSQWILQRSNIQEEDRRILVGMPQDDTLMGGPERKMSNWAFENWLMYQIGTEDYAFKDAYDGPTNRVVIHDGRGPYGDYRKAKHAILWCYSNSDRDGKDPKAKEKWFALHGIKFEPGQKYFLNDQFFATAVDMTDYNVAHAKAEQARWDLLKVNEEKQEAVKTKGDRSPTINTAEHVYWAAEPDYQPTELDRQLYQALKRWGYPLPFEEDEIDVIWRSRDKTMEMDTRKEQFVAERDDFAIWFGRAGKGTKIRLSKLEAKTDEKQYSVALLAWDTANFATAKTLNLWSMWNSEVTVKLPFTKAPEIYAVNWLGKRLYQVKPMSVSKDHVTFATIRDDDVFCYEIAR